MYVNATEFSPLYLQHSFMYQIKNSVSQEERETVGFDTDGDEAILGPIAQYNPATGITKTVLGYEFWGKYNEHANYRAQLDVKYEDAFQGIAVDGEGKVYFKSESEHCALYIQNCNFRRFAWLCIAG